MDSPPTPPPQYTAEAPVYPPPPPRPASYAPAPYNPATYAAPAPYDPSTYASPPAHLASYPSASQPPPSSSPAAYFPQQNQYPPPPPPPQSSSSIPPVKRPGVVPGPDSWLSTDPRSSSTQSLLPAESIGTSRRTLLIIYIHGFLGNDQSFRSFPAHVHALLSAMLAETHVIHTKIYPRYKTYRAVEVARDNFSAWLEPHESPNTDVVLVGHSMGGILAADVVLMPNKSPYGQQSLKHRILGHISLDCPFLGLHPGIIVSGISSLFKPAATPPQDHAPPQDNYEIPNLTSPGSSSLNVSTSQNSYAPSIASSSSTPSGRPPTDPFFNPPFPNDASFREAPFVKRMVHFANKYKEQGIVQAAARHVMSYLEFGGCLADPRGLEARYIQLRALEDVDELQPFGPGKDPNGPTQRVRFVNYYTICNGRPKEPKVATPRSEVPGESEGSSSSKQSIDAGSQQDGASTFDPDATITPQTALDEKDHPKDQPESSRPSIQIDHADSTDKIQTSGSFSEKGKECHESHSAPDPDTVSLMSDMDNMSMNYVDPSPIDDSDDQFFDAEPSQSQASETQTSNTQLSKIDTPDTQSLSPQISTAQTSTTQLSSQSNLDLPPIPDAPTPPTLPDISQYTDKDARKQAERESKRLQKAYDQAVKDRAKALKERDKLLEKRRRKAEKEAEKLTKSELKEMERLQKDTFKEQQRLEKEALKKEREEEHRTLKDEHDRLLAALEAEKPRKRRQFCNLPDKVNGVRDRAWVEIFMADVDEVGAHCGLFFPGPQYETLVGDVGSRILGWVEEDMTKRAILEMGEELD
ncbi:Fc.00g051190.m01.CDS01 [Cosmosporella sp. VM-42]